jgi:NAD(P)H dehydrogenase (quinone)
LTDTDAPVRVLIVFYSRDGSTEQLACAMAAGAEAAGAEVRICRTRELVDAETMALAKGWTESAERMGGLYPHPEIDDAEWAEAICLGSPTRFGGAASELRAWLETLGRLWITGKLTDKIGCAFSSASSIHGGLETTVLGLYPAMAHLGMIVVPQGYGHPAAMTAGSPYGVGSISAGPKRLPPTDDDVALARYQGERVAKIALATRSLRSPA